MAMAATVFHEYRCISSAMRHHVTLESSRRQDHSLPTPRSSASLAGVTTNTLMSSMILALFHWRSR